MDAVEIHKVVNISIYKVHREFFRMEGVRMRFAAASFKTECDSPMDNIIGHHSCGYSANALKLHDMSNHEMDLEIMCYSHPNMEYRSHRSTQRHSTSSKKSTKPRFLWRNLSALGHAYSSLVPWSHYGVRALRIPLIFPWYVSYKGHDPHLDGWAHVEKPGHEDITRCINFSLERPYLGTEQWPPSSQRIFQTNWKLGTPNISLSGWINGLQIQINFFRSCREDPTVRWHYELIWKIRGVAFPLRCVCWFVQHAGFPAHFAYACACACACLYLCCLYQFLLLLLPLLSSSIYLYPSHLCQLPVIVDFWHRSACSGISYHHITHTPSSVSLSSLA